MSKAQKLVEELNFDAHGYAKLLAGDVKDIKTRCKTAIEEATVVLEFLHKKDKSDTQVGMDTVTDQAIAAMMSLREIVVKTLRNLDDLAME